MLRIPLFTETLVAVTVTKRNHVFKYSHSIKKNTALIEYKEKQHIFRWKFPLNLNET